MRLVNADKLKQDHFMGNECETCINDVGHCQNWHTYTKMDFCGWIDDAPTVDPFKHGHWEFKHLWKGAEAKYCECSACHKPAWWETDYCPNCGAKMDE